MERSLSMPLSEAPLIWLRGYRCVVIADLLILEDQLVPGTGRQHRPIAVGVEVDIKDDALRAAFAAIQQLRRSAPATNVQTKILVDNAAQGLESRDEVALARSIRADEHHEVAKFHRSGTDREIALDRQLGYPSVGHTITLRRPGWSVDQ
jgi:hypothetical protein